MTAGVWAWVSPRAAHVFRQDDATIRVDISAWSMARLVELAKDAAAHGDVELLEAIGALTDNTERVAIVTEYEAWLDTPLSTRQYLRELPAYRLEAFLLEANTAGNEDLAEQIIDWLAAPKWVK